MQSQAERILAQGLKSGYAGKGKRLTVRRGPFTLTAEELTFPGLNASYNDHWIAKRVGGGQEIARTGSDMATRVFAGGIVRPDTLAPLGITESDVLGYLKRTLSELAEATRLRENVTRSDGDWQYAYEVLKSFPEVPLTMGLETITYKGTPVFVHAFLNAPVV